MVVLGSSSKIRMLSWIMGSLQMYEALADIRRALKQGLKRVIVLKAAI